MPAYSLQQVERTQEEYERLHQQLSAEIDSCAGLDRSRMNHVQNFLEENGIWHTKDMDYNLRQAFGQYLEGRMCRDTACACITVFDKIKQHSIREQMQTLAGQMECRWKYDNKVLFIPYHHDQEVMQKYDRVRFKENVVWDFEIVCNEKMKRQVFEILNYTIENYEVSRLREYKLTGLQLLYSFCVENDITDIECLELAQIELFYGYVNKRVEKEQRRKNMTAIVETARKILFLQGSEIHWNANVWYLERFRFAPERINPSQKIESISFAEVMFLENRTLLKEFMKYELGVTDLAISSAYETFRILRNFLQTMDGKNINACKCPTEYIDKYFKELQEKGNSSKTFNREIVAIQFFYKFLEIKGHIKRVPFNPEYYFQKEMPVHHDRSVAEGVCMEIIGNLKYFPEHLRLMFLHLWCVGLRISEVCTLKGNAYFRQGQDVWIQVYQVKLRTYKRVPIPEVLYKLMRVYLKKNEIGADDYAFTNKDGSPFPYSTFCWQMKKYCRKYNIAGGEYIFKTHDYRHTVATMYYDCGVSIQSIRDYLGHNYEEMTEQYIDYMPKKIAKANEEYFAQNGGGLASGIKRDKKGDRHGEQDLL